MSIDIRFTKCYICYLKSVGFIILIVPFFANRFAIPKTKVFERRNKARLA